MKLNCLYFSILFSGSTQSTNSNYLHNQLYSKVLFNRTVRRHYWYAATDDVVRTAVLSHSLRKKRHSLWSPIPTLCPTQITCREGGCLKSKKFASNLGDDTALVVKNKMVV
jgi:hypothetical protein